MWQLSFIVKNHPEDVSGMFRHVKNSVGFVIFTAQFIAKFGAGNSAGFL